MSCVCGARWTGAKMAHCSACHNTFSRVSNFDRHRKDFTCWAPENVGLIASVKGIWHLPGREIIT